MRDVLDKTPRYARAGNAMRFVRAAGESVCFVGDLADSDVVQRGMLRGLPLVGRLK
jgi:hypothetical protein